MKYTVCLQITTECNIPVEADGENMAALKAISLYVNSIDPNYSFEQVLEKIIINDVQFEPNQE